MEDIMRIIYVDMPTTLKAYTMYDGLGFYTVYINSRLSVEQNVKSFIHEVFHIKNGDYELTNDVQIIENVSHCI